MYYFKASIGTNSDGTRISYSPGWCGEMALCPKGLKAILYNDKEGYLVGQAEDTFIPPEVKVISKKEVIEIIRKDVRLVKADTEEEVSVDNFDIDIQDSKITFFSKEYQTGINMVTGEKIYAGESLDNRWLPQAIKEELSPEEVAEVNYTLLDKEIDTLWVEFCPKCHKQVCRVIRYEDNSVEISQGGRTVIKGIIAKEISLSCPAGHKVKVVLNGD